MFVCLTPPAYNTDRNSVTINTWLENAIQDAERRGLPELRPLLEALARSTSALRTADWNFDATGPSGAGRADGLDTPMAADGD